MAKLVRVCRFNEEENSRNDCQIPIIIDAELKVRSRIYCCFVLCMLREVEICAFENIIFVRSGQKTPRLVKKLILVIFL